MRFRFTLRSLVLAVLGCTLVGAAPARAAYLFFNLPGVTAPDDPSLVTVRSQGVRLYAVMARGTDGALWAQFGTGTSWYGWSRVGGTIKNAPACVDLLDSIYCVARWSDNSVRLIGWNRDQRRWGTWLNLGGVTNASPAIAAQRDLNPSAPYFGLLIAHRGTDLHLYTKVIDNMVTISPSWKKYDAISQYTPACGNIDSFPRCLLVPAGTYNLHLMSDLGQGPGAQGSFFNTGGITGLRGTIAVPSLNAERARIFVAGLDGHLWSLGWKKPGLPLPDGPDGWGPWFRSSAVQLASAPSCVQAPGTTKEFWCAHRTAQGNVRVLRWIPKSLNPLVE